MLQNSSFERSAKKAFGPWTLELAVGRHRDVEDLGILPPGLDVKDGDLLRVDFGEAIG